jgi:transcriptional regulator with XRE-family HTH domain
MNKSYLSKRLKELRSQKGMSQEALSYDADLSLRTIQRIENGETNPTGNTVKRLSNALNINPDELIDWTIKEDRKFLIHLNLSALTFLFFPLLGILIPFILWTSKKDKIKDINTLGKQLINFEITWTILLFFIPILLFLISKSKLIENFSLSLIFTVTGCMYLFNLILILLNTFRLSNKKNVMYFPKLNFLR